MKPDRSAVTIAAESRPPMPRKGLFVASLLTAAIAVACGSKEDATEETSPAPSIATPVDRAGSMAAPASTVFALSGGNFAANSIRICGERNARANGAYPCASSISEGTWTTLDGAPGAANECPCFDFDADGNVIDPASGAEAVIDGLCTSDEAPAADWTFRYEIYAAPGCKNAHLNDGTHNFTCYDSRDLATLEHPNAATAPLQEGRNINQIVCVTENASKTWRFDSCAIMTTSADAANRSVRYDCGCDSTAPGDPGAPGPCVCPGGLSNVPNGCAFEPSTCDLVCRSSK